VTPRKNYSPQLQKALGRELANQLFGLSFYCLDRAPAGGAGKKGEHKNKM
jgi:hypothetical protein